MYIIRASIVTVHILCSYLSLLVVLIVQVYILSHLELQCLPPYDSLHISRAISWVTLPCKVSIYTSLMRVSSSAFSALCMVVISTRCIVYWQQKFLSPPGGSPKPDLLGFVPPGCRHAYSKSRVATPSCSRARGCGYARLAFSSQG